MNALIFFFQYCMSKLTVLELLLKIAWHVNDEIILERLLPYMLFLVNDPLPQVRAQALKILSHCLQLVRSVPRSDANIIISRVCLAKFIMAHSRSGGHCENCICWEHGITGRDGFEISGDGAVRLYQSRQQWWLTYSVSGIIIFFKGTGCGWIVSVYIELRGQVFIIVYLKQGFRNYAFLFSANFALFFGALCTKTYVQILQYF